MEPLRVSECGLPILNLEPSSVKDVCVHSIASPFDFYVQIIDMLKDFEELEKNIQHYYSQSEISTLMQLKAPTIGQLCVSIFDERWYRAIITSK